MSEASFPESANGAIVHEQLFSRERRELSRRPQGGNEMRRTCKLITHIEPTRNENNPYLGRRFQPVVYFVHRMEYVRRRKKSFLIPPERGRMIGEGAGFKGFIA